MNETTQPKTRLEMEFEVLYSMHLERMNANLSARLDRMTIICMIAFAIAGAGGVIGVLTMLIGVACFGGFRVLIRPHAAAQNSMASFHRWHAISMGMKETEDSLLLDAIASAGALDTRVAPALVISAHRAAAKDLDLDLDAVRQPNFPERLAAFLAGVSPY